MTPFSQQGAAQSSPQGSSPEARTLTENDWRRYYDAVAGHAPHDTLLSTLSRFEAEGGAAAGAAPAGAARLAVDLGCGDGRDTAEMLRRGWRVLAVDAQPEAIRRLRARPDLPPDAEERLTTRVAGFHEVELPGDVHLVNASFCLPFCPPEHFPAVWERIVGVLAPGGRFCGHLFGVNDDWAGRPDRTHHTRAEVEALLAPLTAERLEEQEWDGTTALCTPKHWHAFYLVARREKV